MIARDLAEFEFSVWAYSASKFCMNSTHSACSAFLITKDTLLHSILELRDLYIFLAKLMLILRLFVL